MTLSSPLRRTRAVSAHPHFPGEQFGLNPRTDQRTAGRYKFRAP
jgi:hypothetical protein